LCTHLKLCISQSADCPDDGPSSSTPGFASSEPSVFTPGPASLHRVESLDAAERIAAHDFIGLETTDKVVLGGTFLPEMWHNQDSTHAATTKLIEAVSAAQFEDTQNSVANLTLASEPFSTMECVAGPPSLAQDQSAQVESSAITSQDTAPLPPAGTESAQVESSAITSQDTAPLPPAGTESAQVESSAITSQDTAPLPPAGTESAQVKSSAITSQDTAPLPPAGTESAQVESSAITSQDTAPLPPAGKESAQVESSAIVHGTAAQSFAEKDITQSLLRSTSEATMNSGRSTPLSLIAASSVVGLASQNNSSRKSKLYLQKKARASITSPLMPPKSTAHAETVHFIDFIDFMCVALSD